MKNKTPNKQSKMQKQAFLSVGISMILFVSLLFSTTCAFANSSGVFKIRQEHLNINGVLVSRPSSEDEEISKLLKENNIHNPQEYAAWLVKNIKFQYDGSNDNWATPHETLTRKFGDCEDFAFLNISVLRVMGYKAKFVAFFNPSIQNHAVCIFEDNGQFYYFDNMNLKPIEETNILDFAKNKMVQNQYVSIKELDVDTKKWELLYKTS